MPVRTYEELVGEKIAYADDGLDAADNVADVFASNGFELVVAEVEEALEGDVDVRLEDGAQEPLPKSPVALPA